MPVRMDLGGMQRIELNYGRGRLPVDLADDLDLRMIRKRPMPVLPDPEAAVREALARAGRGAAAGRARARQAERLHPDLRHHPAGAERPVPAAAWSSALLAAGLARRGASRSWSRPACTGPNEGAELEELVGSRWVLETVEVANHFARDDAAHVDLGTTRRRGVPVKLDRRLVEAELKIATGLVEPHFMAG